MPPPLPKDQGPMYYDIEDLQFAAREAQEDVGRTGADPFPLQAVEDLANLE